MEKRRESEAVNSTVFRINMERRERGASFSLQDELRTVLDSSVF
jgi:hypothetical protein